jgi:hypothetical protein
MSSPLPGSSQPVPQSRQIEAYREGLLARASYHEQVIAGLADIVDAINGLSESLPELPGPISDNVDILVGGFGKILQGLTDLEATKVTGLQNEAAALLPVIEQARAAESGIVTAHRVPRTN